MSEASAYPSDWRATTLGALADYMNGYPFKPRDWTTVGLPIVRIAQMTDVTAAFDYCADPLAPEYRIDSGDLLFSWSATLTALIWQRGPAYLNQHIYKVIPRDGNDLGFLHHLLNQLIDPLANQSHGTTMKHITRGDLLPYPVTVPPPTEQSRIAAVLDTVDEAIAKTEAVIAKLKQVRAGLLHDLLTRGLDENGQLRDPIAHPEQFQDSPIGRIPRGWEILSVIDLFEMQLGKMLSPKAKRGGDARPYIGNRHVLWDHVDCSDLEYMDFTPDERAKYALQVDDLLICEGGEVGRTAIWCGELSECFFQKAIHRLRPKDNRIIPQYMLAFLKRAAERGAFVNLTSQTSIAHLTQEKLALLQVALPLKIEQEKMVELWTSLDVGQQNEEVFLTKLRHLKSALMADLLTGRVRVPASL